MAILFRLSLLLMAIIGGIGPVSEAWAGPSPIRFVPTSGIDLFWPEGGPVASNNVYLADPYTSSETGSVSNHVTSAVLAQVKTVGIDHIRDQVSPGPWLQAIAAGTSLTFLDTQLDTLINSELNAGLGVVLSPYASEYTPTDHQLTMLASLNSPAYINYKTWLVHLSQRYANLDPTQFAIELMNEPVTPGQGQADWATVIQPDLYAAVRAVAPNLTIILTAANYSDLHLLGGVDYSGNGSPSQGLNPTGYDANTMWSFHPFIPYVFTLQGASYDSNLKYVHTLSWPPVAADQPAVIATMTAAVNADGSLSASSKTSTINYLTQQIGSYYSVPEDKSYVDGQFNIVDNWLAYWHLPAAAIYVGEYGNLRTNFVFKGTDDLSRIRFHRDLHGLLVKHGFRSAFDHLDTYDYGVTTGQGSTIGSFIPGLITAIGPDRLHLVKY